MTRSDRNSRMTFSRTDLYRQVWTTPVSRLAQQSGLSGRGLAKLCERMDIPRPPRGYWARKAAGQKLKTVPLPEPGRGIPEQVTVRPGRPSRMLARLSPELQAAYDAALEEAADVVVPARLSRPHPVIANWLDEHRKEKEAARRHRDWNPSSFLAGGPRPFSSMDRRRHRILNALFKAIEIRGAVVREEDRRTFSAEMERAAITFSIREKLKMVRIPLTEDEKQWRTYGNGEWRQEQQATGNLLFTLRTGLPSGLKHEWLETDERLLEEMLPEIVATFVTAYPCLIEKQRAREEAERQRELAERERYRREQEQKRDDNRWGCLVEFARRREEAELIRKFISEVRSTNPDPNLEVNGRPLGEWLTWAEQKAEATDPLNRGAEAMFRVIASVNEWNYRPRTGSN